MIAIFGGTAAYHLRVEDFARVLERRAPDTPYGQAAPFLLLETAAGRRVWFSSRHGEDSLQRSAAFVNHRANLWAAHELGVQAVLSWNGVGAIAPGLSVGQCVVVDDVLDMTRARLAATFGAAARQTPAGGPFDAAWRQKLVTACAALGLPCATHGTYVCSEGPRLETAAEIALFGWGGAAVVGMTLVPEVWLAAELALPYASLCIVTNLATGRWHLDARRDFGVGVAHSGLRALLAAVDGTQAAT
ncbi:MAG: MTAP family purine nucleoside phosphorylase [Chloroflexi bacterium]|nr:MTAP family purine nucleoside phosphorylase [Chloroflexota bacterium]